MLFFDRVFRTGALMLLSSKVALRGLRRLRLFGVGILTFSCAQLVVDYIITIKITSSVGRGVKINIQGCSQ